MIMVFDIEGYWHNYISIIKLAGIQIFGCDRNLIFK